MEALPLLNVPLEEQARALYDMQRFLDQTFRDAKIDGAMAAQGYDTTPAGSLIVVGLCTVYADRIAEIDRDIKPLTSPIASQIEMSRRLPGPDVTVPQYAGLWALVGEQLDAGEPMRAGSRLAFDELQLGTIQEAIGSLRALRFRYHPRYITRSLRGIAYSQHD